MEGKQFFKTTHWYNMGIKDPDQKLIPQTEEGISRVVWTGKDQLDEVFKNTYLNIKWLINKVLLTEWEE